MQTTDELLPQIEKACVALEAGLVRKHHGDRLQRHRQGLSRDSLVPLDLLPANAVAHLRGR